MPLTPFLHRIVQRQTLSAADAEQVMRLVLGGEVSAAQLAAFLVALHMRGETVEEILGFARAMRDQGVRVPVASSGPLLDTCGTGGDGSGTFNISTVTAFVVAGAGVRVAKHGNRSATSLCGSADLLEGLGVNIRMTPEQVGCCIDEVGIGFLFAQTLHSSMRHAHEARRALRLRTAFNLLGPLTNPAGANVQLIGAPSEGAAALMAEVLAQLGLERGFIVHGADGLDEVSTTGPTACWEVRDGIVTETQLTPDDFGLPPTTLDQLAGGGLETNLSIARAILGGELGPRRDVVLANAALALMAAGVAGAAWQGTQLAAQALDSGAAAQKLSDLVACSRRLSGRNPAADRAGAT